MNQGDGLPEESRPKSINQLFSAITTASHAEIRAFVVFCIKRIPHLIETDNSRNAFQQLMATGTVSPELAEQANIDSNSLSLQHSSAAKAVGHAVCHCTSADSFHFSDDRVENARLVALYCQWAVSRDECPPDPDDEIYCDDDDDDEDYSGRQWLVRQIEDREQAAQLRFVFDNLPHWVVDAKDA